MEKADLLRERAEDLKVLSEDEYQKLMIFFSNFIHICCQDPHQQSRARMQVVATAILFFRRFYARRSLKDIDPFLMAPTCVVLASKVEEHGMLSAQKIDASYKMALKKYPFLTQEPSIRPVLMQEAEFFLLEILDCCLVVYHPYRPLTQLWLELATLYKDSKDLEELKSVSWKVCNDSLKTDASLLYPPHLIAIACIMIAAIWTNRDLKAWFSEFAVDFEKVFEIQQLIFNMYNLARGFNESEQLGAILEKMPKPAQSPRNLNGSQQQPPPQHINPMMTM